jgi:hypothetical protein
MIYYAKRHRGEVFVDGVKVSRVTHCDTVLGYAVRFATNQDGKPYESRRGRLKREVCSRCCFF